MAFICIKTIKGRQYYYLQSSKRIGGKVKSTCTYLGPVGKVSPSHSVIAGAHHSSSSPKVEKQSTGDQSQSTRYHYTETGVSSDGVGSSSGSVVVGNDPTPKRSSRVQTTEKKKRPSNRDSRASTLDQFPDWGQVSLGKLKLSDHNIRLQTLAKKRDQNYVWLKRLGIQTDPESLPIIQLAYGRGKTVTTTRSWVTGSYTITIPRPSRKHKKTNRAAIYRSFQETLIRSGLDEVAKKKPVLYARLADQFDDSYSKTNKALLSYLSHSNTNDVWVKAACLRLFGTLSKASEVLPQADRMGLVNFDKRPDWKSELVGILAEVQTKGWSKVLAKQQENERLATAYAKSSITLAKHVHLPFSRKWWQRRNRIKRALARELAVKQMGRKLHLIQTLLRPED